MSIKSFGRVSAVLLVLVLGVGGRVASAQFIVVEPDAFPAGTDISHAYPGVTLSAATGADPRVFSFTPTLASASTLSRVFGHLAPFEEQWGDGAINDLRADLAVPGISVQVDIIANDSIDVGTLKAFNSSNVLLDSKTSPSIALGRVATLTITRPSADIAYIIATGTDLETVNLDNLRFNVPEPTAAALAALILPATLRRRRTR
jgi:hypothetical protein